MLPSITSNWHFNDLKNGLKNKKQKQKKTWKSLPFDK